MKMYALFSGILGLMLITSCKQAPKEESVTAPELSTAQKIAKAHGIDSWNQVEELNFTFNVDRDTVHFERSWSWKVKSNEVRLISSGDTISYNRAAVDSTNMRADQGFINDVYWLLAPYKLVWDKGFSSSEEKGIAPISGDSLNKLTIVYDQESGGYTPGDAYDFYFGDDYVVREWVFRKGNQPEPGLITSWEDYAELSGLIIAQKHKRSEGNWTLSFTGLSVKP